MFIGEEDYFEIFYDLLLLVEERFMEHALLDDYVYGCDETF